MKFLLLLVVMVEAFLKSRGSQIVNFGFMIMSLGGLSGDHVKRHKAQDPNGDLPEI